jgi:hypothetical protein
MLNTNLKNTVSEDVDRKIAQIRTYVKTVLNFRTPCKEGNFLSSHDTNSFSKTTL